MQMADRYGAPEEALIALQRERKTRLTLVVIGLIAAVVVMIGASALMYGDDAQYQPQPTGAR
jgi:hypothetical protein